MNENILKQKPTATKKQKEVIPEIAACMIKLPNAIVVAPHSKPCYCSASSMVTLLVKA
jgi:hypothetical protein